MSDIEVTLVEVDGKVDVLASLGSVAKAMESRLIMMIPNSVTVNRGDKKYDVAYEDYYFLLKAGADLEKMNALLK